ncbi:glycogen synthase [Rubritalea halochordaticola]|uniref:starch synthase n=1 Tax=Rubritalea halochordaticola TaxID=714537 RepID=A0ABP9V5Y7_9BACT
MSKSPKDSGNLLIEKDTVRAPRARILVVTPEITYLPAGMGNLAQRLSAKAGGMADVSASLVNALYQQGADVHVALPNYRKMFHTDVKELFNRNMARVSGSLPEQRIHLAEDRIFYHRSKVYDGAENISTALAFQREVINHIIPMVQPDLIHCNDWMTGLIPAAAKRLGIPCLFTVHNIHSEKVSMAAIEDKGIDAADFWQNIYFCDRPESYEHAREHIPVDLLTTGIFSSDHVNSVSPTFLYEVVEGRHSFVPDSIRNELANKLYAGCATGILNAPDESFDPKTDLHLEHHYGIDDFTQGKAANKFELQQAVGLDLDPNAPILFWPSRLDPMQKGCQLLADIMYQLVSDYSHMGLQIAIVASGSFAKHFDDIVEMHDLQGKVAVVEFTEKLSRLGYAGSDFMLMPSRFEPCGLPQMVSPKYGTLPIVHDTGGIHDTVDHLHYDGRLGNGFRFQHYSAEGLRWAIDEALNFYQWQPEAKAETIRRIMRESRDRFSHETTAATYINLYENMLGRPVVKVRGMD